MIIIGYQGIGKSTLSNANTKCIDLESGNFWVDGNRADDWYKSYCQIANYLSKQGYTVFVSSHEVVRKELEKSDELVCIVHPAIELEAEWLSKLEDRYIQTNSTKDYKALMNAKDRYKDNINELSTSPFVTYEIESIDYDLKDIVNTLAKLDRLSEEIVGENNAR